METWSAAPADWIASWSENATNVTFPIASLPQLTDVEADGTTGDIRKVLFALLHEIAAVYGTLPVAEQPSYFKFYPSATTNPTTGEITRTYTVQFTTAISGEEVKDEPA